VRVRVCARGDWTAMPLGQSIPMRRPDSKSRQLLPPQFRPQQPEAVSSSGGHTPHVMSSGGHTPYMVSQVASPVTVPLTLAPRPHAFCWGERRQLTSLVGACHLQSGGSDQIYCSLQPQSHVVTGFLTCRRSLRRFLTCRRPQVICR